MAEPQPQSNSTAIISTEHLNQLAYCIGSSVYKPRDQIPSKLVTGARFELVLGNKLVLPKGLCKKLQMSSALSAVKVEQLLAPTMKDERRQQGMHAGLTNTIEIL